MSVLGRSCNLRRVVMGAVLAGGLGLSAQAQANGRFPASTNAEFQPGDNKVIVLPTTFGLLVSEDDGESFLWVCEETIGYGGTYDPDYALTTDGSIYATTFDGVQVSRDGACTFSDTEFYGDLSGGNSPVLLAPGYFVSEIEVASDGRIWAATSTGANSNNIYVSTDGIAFHSTNAYQEVAWWKSLRVSKSSPDVAYAAGYQIPGSDPVTPSKALLFKTVDGGANWTDLGTDSFAFGGQPNLIVTGISPLNPDIVYAKVLAARVPEGDDLYRSDDGGLSFVKVVEMNSFISAFAVRNDGSVIVGQSTPCADDFIPEADAAVPNKGCVRISPDGTPGSWTTPAEEPKMGCVNERGADNKLFTCGHNWEPDNFALGFSDDGAQSWTKVTRLGDVAGPLSCPEGSVQHTCEVNSWPAVCTMLGICEPATVDAGVTGNPDAGVITEPPGDDSCLGCQSGTSGGLPFAGFVLSLYFLAFRRRKQSEE